MAATYEQRSDAHFVGSKKLGVRSERKPLGGAQVDRKRNSSVFRLFVIPAQAGIHAVCQAPADLDSRLRGLRISSLSTERSEAAHQLFIHRTK